MTTLKVLIGRMVALMRNLAQDRMLVIYAPKGCEWQHIDVYSKGHEVLCRLYGWKIPYYRGEFKFDFDEVTWHPYRKVEWVSKCEDFLKSYGIDPNSRGWEVDPIILPYLITDNRRMSKILESLQRNVKE